MKKKRPPCPVCSTADPRPIAYGFPTVEGFEAADRGEIALGGCMIRDEMPAFECRACRHRYVGEIKPD